MERTGHGNEATGARAGRTTHQRHSGTREGLSNKSDHEQHRSVVQESISGTDDTYRAPRKGPADTRKFCPIILVWSAVACQQHNAAPDEFTHQVDRLLSEVRIPRYRLREIPFVLRDLELVLNAIWPGSRVLVFGSVVHGLATVTSDVDCTVLLPHRRDTTQTVLDEAKTTLQNYPQTFTDLHPLLASVPVITFIHLPTQHNVDLTVNNYHGLQISNLFNYLLRSDERLYQLSFIVKHWAKTQGITNKDTLPNYGMLLMLIFYLQQMSIFPSIATLQNDVNPFYVNGWNIAFREIKYDVNLNVTLGSLLCGFFELYEKFDYDNKIVSPYTGNAIEKRLFYDLNTVPNELRLYWQNVRSKISTPLNVRNGIIIQDVFTHNSNVANNVNSDALFKLKAKFQCAAEKFRENATAFLDSLSDSTK